MSSAFFCKRCVGAVTLAVLAAFVVLDCPVTMAAAPAGSLASETFYYTGEPQSYVVPAGVSSLAGEVSGAGGGAGAVGRRSVPTIDPAVTLGGYESAAGGLGGSASATLAVSAGEELTIKVGSAGASGDTGTETKPARGGYNGGAPSGTADSPNSDGGGGGGSSEILSSGAPLLVGGGGGGGGGRFVGYCETGASEVLGRGGDGGENGLPGDGEDGTSATENEAVHVSVGAVIPSAAPLVEPSSLETGQGGFGGSAEHPGGPHGLGSAGGSGEYSGGGGGGGGGGYYGGGGGAFGACGVPGAITGGGGGGGSDYAFPGATNVTLQRASNSEAEDNGSVTLSYYVPYPTSTQATPSPAVANVGETITITATVTSGVSCAGSVQFELDGEPIDTPVAVHEGSAETTITAPPAGEYPIAATYSGTPSTATAAGCLLSTSTPSTLTTRAQAPAAAPAPVVPAATITPVTGNEALVEPEACQSARAFVIHLLIPRQQKLTSAQVYVDGKLVKRLTGGVRQYRLSLRGRPYSTVTVKLVAEEPDGKRVVGERIYHTCRAYSLPGHKNFKL